MARTIDALYSLPTPAAACMVIPRDVGDCSDERRLLLASVRRELPS
jgi:hypothetical protein